MKKIIFSTALVLSTVVSFSQWTEISTDASGDSGGIDATLLEYQYDAVEDKVAFRVTVTNLATYSASPSADFSFFLPAGLESGSGAGTHWSSTTEVHKTAYIYCDLGGTAPSDYTYTGWGQTIEETSTLATLCSNCVDIYADVAENQITYTFNRTDIISDVEMDGETEVTIGLVANVGHDIGWDDAMTHESGGASSASFTINLAAIDDASVYTNAVVNQVSTYPNPASQSIQFKLEDKADELLITDLLGNEVIRLDITQGLNNIDISMLSNGLYLLSVYDQTTLVGQSKITKN